MASGDVSTLICSNANLLYHLPPSLQVEKSLKKMDYILALSACVDETSSLANAILPTSHFLESWGDFQHKDDLFSVQQPVLRPLHQTRSFEDYLIALAGGDLQSHSSFYSFIQAEWAARFKNESPAGSFRKSWQACLQRGYYQKRSKNSQASLAPRSFISKAVGILPKVEAQISKSLDDHEFHVGVYYNLQVMDGSLANNAYRQELPDPVTKIVWDNYLCVLPETARKLGFKQGMLVQVTVASLNSEKTSLTLPVHLQPGLDSKTAMIALGYGRTKAGKVANHVGKNATLLGGVGSDSFLFSGMVAKIKPDGEERYHLLASTQSIYKNKTNQESKAPFTPKGFHELPYQASSQHGRPILREAAYEEVKKGKFELKPKGVPYPKKQDLTKKWDYKETKWHMVVDLNLCNGCGACVTSCNTENNIPMVGKKEVSVGREMHWMRIDRYFDGDETAPNLAHQPMLCQHCENAPCENVCPVAATTHNQEGLNVMTYNRCIGTRYCANNCPYKVRRFNWFENWHAWGGAHRELRSPQQLALNPDVSVRSRGVMEKCTFCIQRIASVRHANKVKGQDVFTDGQVVTACQEVCPTNAISFGNIVDSKSEVARLKTQDKRAYQVLDFLGVKPQVTYLAKVRNKKKSQQLNKAKH